MKFSLSISKGERPSMRAGSTLQADFVGKTPGAEVRIKRSATRCRLRFRSLPYLVLLLLMPLTLMAQEKKLLRVVFVSLSWNSEIPFRVAMGRGFFKSQGLQIEPIFIRGGPA